jgi:hypothetical protein
MLPRRRWKDNIRMDFRKIGWEDVDWIRPSQGDGQVTTSFEQGNKLPGSIKTENFLTS